MPMNATLDGVTGRHAHPAGQRGDNRSAPRPSAPYARYRRRAAFVHGGLRAPRDAYKHGAVREPAFTMSSPLRSSYCRVRPRQVGVTEGRALRETVAAAEEGRSRDRIEAASHLRCLPRVPAESSSSRAKIRGTECAPRRDATRAISPPPSALRPQHVYGDIAAGGEEVARSSPRMPRERGGRR